MKKILIFFLAFIIVSCGLGNKTKVIETPTQLKAKFVAPADWYMLTLADYSIRCPPSWREDTMFRDMGFRVFDDEDSLVTNHRPNVTLMTINLNGLSFSTDEFIKETRQNMDKVFINFNIVANKKIKVDSLEYDALVYTFTKNKNSKTELEDEQWVCAVDGKIYELDFVAEKIIFDKYKELGEDIMSTFTLK